MSPTLIQILDWISHYKYFAIFPLSIVEGPIITILSGFLASLGKINIYLVYAIVILGDLIGDSVLYFLGKHTIGRNIPSWLRYLGIDRFRYELIKEKFIAHPKKIIVLGKFLYGIGSLTIFMAGSVKMKYRLFLQYDLAFTAIKSLTFLLIGYFFGSAYSTIDTYFGNAEVVIIIAFVLCYGAFVWYSEKYIKSREL